MNSIGNVSKATLLFLSVSVAMLGRLAAAEPVLNDRWTMVPTHGVPVQGVGWEQLTYATGAKKHVFFSGFHEPSSEPNQALAAYDFSSNRWDLLDVGGLFHNENM